jgi:predicted O-methyltransferase YrrM
MFRTRSIIEYLWIRIIGGYRKSKRIHSPFINDFIAMVVRGKDTVEFSEIDRLNKQLRYDSMLLNIQDLGAGSLSGTGKNRRISQIVRYSSIQPKYGKFLSRLVHWMLPSTIIELGTGAGISTMYMAITWHQCKVFTIEGCTEIAGLADENMKSLGLKNTEIITGSFDEILPAILQKIQHPLLIFIDGDHIGQHLTGYYETILPFTDENSVFVFDDIRWSESMEKAWKGIIKREEVSVSIDLFRMGILFLKKNIKKQQFIVTF